MAGKGWDPLSTLAPKEGVTFTQPLSLKGHWTFLETPRVGRGVVLPSWCTKCVLSPFGRVQLFVTPVDCNPQVPSVRGILQARILE